MKRKNALAVNSLPVLPDLNEQIFERAGISLQDRADLLTRVFKRTGKRLQATHIKVFHDQDGTHYSKPLVDHTTQGKAIDQAMQLVGLQKSEAPKIILKASVMLPAWAVPNVSDVPTKQKRSAKTITVKHKQITGPSEEKRSDKE
jgi:hypothetical protein